MKKTLQKVKLTKVNHLEVAYDFTEEAGEELLKGFVEMQANWDVHDDLKKALDALRVHLVLLAEQVEDPGDHRDVTAEQLAPYRVTGVTWGGEGEYRGITLIGQKRLKGKRVLNLITPFIQLEAEDDPYRYLYELQAALVEVEVETLHHLDGKRQRPAVQQTEINFDNPENKPSLN